VKRLVCSLIGHYLPCVIHPWWGDCYHAKCGRCGQECVGYYDPQYGDIDWRAVSDKPRWFALPPFPKWRGWGGK